MDKSQFKVVDYRNTKQVVYGENLKIAKMNNRFIKMIENQEAEQTEEPQNNDEPSA